jgi:hypothetical protein
MNKHREKLLADLLSEKQKLESLANKPEYVETHLIAINTIEDFILKAEESHVDEKLAKKLFSLYKKLDALEEKQEKELFHHMMKESLDHKLSKKELDEQMHVFGEIMSTYHKAVSYEPEKHPSHSDEKHKTHKKTVRKKQQNLTERLWEDVKGGVEVVELGQSLGKISREIGLVELLPFALLL